MGSNDRPDQSQVWSPGVAFLDFPELESVGQLGKGI